jgi:hypothetical protein
MQQVEAFPFFENFLVDWFLAAGIVFEELSLGGW